MKNKNFNNNYDKINCNMRNKVGNKELVIEEKFMIKEKLVTKKKLKIKKEIKMKILKGLY